MSPSIDKQVHIQATTDYNELQIALARKASGSLFRKTGSLPFYTTDIKGTGRMKKSGMSASKPKNTLANEHRRLTSLCMRLPPSTTASRCRIEKLMGINRVVIDRCFVIETATVSSPNGLLAECDLISKTIDLDTRSDNSFLEDSQHRKPPIQTTLHPV
ncbi:hypothetical protein CONLIGDRAFT_648941 [Coniochaeta ligniaria NRRL 30616]|uniref:Uncharacterized protein n=1 Tax=Coniochaeta ligniaria NRRL 30616 TaxID=1408157 RepID=A0A1J7J9E0_9PEZI|nr:hypothetical protein CONLIGDRAFT_648941 [Coniochaeta ligniaria NRRL 30616]